MRAAVLGSPVAHSLSPVLHRAAHASLGLDGWSYEAIECGEAGLAGFLERCGPGWAGLSLTMPLKRAVLPLLDRTEPLAGTLGAANTVVFRDGRRHGYNTDAPGMIAALAEAGIRSAGETLILGGGGTACAALAAVRALGAAQVTVAVRDPGRAGPLLDAAGRLGINVRLIAFSSVVPQGCGLLVVSTVPAGAADFIAERIARGTLAPPAVVLDVVYHPWPTPLATAAEAAGAVVVGGFGLLLHQAARQVELMTSRPAPLAAMRAAGLAELRRRANTTPDRR
jgi:shikimate dehydrogenase